MRSLFTILLLASCCSIRAQQITAVEYFFDNDPGFGNGAQLPVNAAALDATFSFNAAGLPAGVHSLYVRLKNSDNKWSTLYQTLVLTPNDATLSSNITAAEYYFDSDPGFGNALPLSINAGHSLDSTVVFNTGNLAAGNHSLCLRLKNSLNVWSTVYQSNVLITGGNAGPASLVSAEYFYDNDPGFGNGAILPLSGAAIDSTVKFNTAGLLPGIHTLYVRLKNSNNNYSFAYEGNVSVFAGTDSLPKINSLQIAADTISNISTIALNLKAVLDTVVSLPVADNGGDSTVLALQLKDQSGQQSDAALATISLCDLYKPQGGFRSVQYGSTFTLIDTSKFNTSGQIRWLVNDVLFDSTYTTNYNFPAGTVGSVTIKEITGTGCRVDTVQKVLSMPGIEKYAPYFGSYGSDYNLTLFGGGLDSSIDVYLQKGSTIIRPYLKIPHDNNRSLLAVFDFHGTPKTYGYPEIKDDYVLHVVYANNYQYSDSTKKITIFQQEDNTYLKCLAIRYGESCNPILDPGPHLYMRTQDPDFLPKDTLVEPYFASDLTGDANMRVGAWTTFTLSITNTSSIVAKGIPFTIMVPASFDIDTTILNIFTENPGLRDSVSIITEIDTIINGRHLQYKLLAMIYPALGPGETGYFPLKVRTSSDSAYHIYYSIDKRMYGSPMTDLWGPCWGAVWDIGIGFIPGVGCVYAAGSLINDGVTAAYNGINPTSSWFGVGLNIAATAVSCIPGGSIIGQFSKGFAAEVGFFKNTIKEVEAATYVADKGLGTISAANGAANSTDPCAPKNQKPKGKPGKPFFSLDPNRITGNSDYDTVRHYINNFSPQQYNVSFENKATATANAQHVFVIDTLDINKFITYTLINSSFTIGDSIYYLPAFRSSLTRDVKLKNRNDMKVRFVADFDKDKGILRTDFISIDTAGHLWPENSPDGFLPPDIDGIQGTGSISYSVYAKNYNTNDSFSNRANIYFDSNPPILTNTWGNIIDTTRPFSKVVNSIPVSDSTVKLVMQHSDPGSGIDYISFYLKKAGDSVFRKSGYAVGDTILFKGDPGATYSVFTRATDHVGNIEQKDSVADFTVTLATVVPVRLLSFTGRVVGKNEVQLDWVTTNEINSDRFDVERSANGINFSKIGTVAANNNGAVTNRYTLTDPSPLAGNNFYRLKEIDLNGRFIYSPVVKINFSGSGYVSVSPNPASDFVEVRTDAKINAVQLIDGSGKLTRTWLPSLTNKYSLTGISSGLYYLKLLMVNEVQTYRLVID